MKSAETESTSPSNLILTAELEQASQPYIGQWNRLVSTTNWEKGKIIFDWRSALIAAGADIAEYADDSWAQLVGGVTPQHVGRLRRVFQRFGSSYEKYVGIYWSHFHAAIDWDDAEMWLEGAVQSDWSVSEMRRTRWQTLGGDAATQPHDEQIVVAGLDEDVVTASDLPRSIHEKVADVASGPRHDGPDFGDEPAEPYDHSAMAAMSPGLDGDEATQKVASPPIRPFENLPELPPDLADAFDAFKLAILHHKTNGWKKTSAADVVDSLEALKTLALAPADSETVF